MKLFRVALSSWLLAASAPLWAQDSPADPLPAGLAEMIETQDADGQPVIGAKERSYLNGLNDHLTDLLGGLIESEMVTSAAHLRVLLSLELRPQQMEVLLQDNCVVCHTDAEIQGSETLFALSDDKPPHMNLKEVVDDVHFRRGLSCAGCHGGDPSDEFGHEFVEEWPDTGRDENRKWVLDFCARCHSDPTFMNQFNPGLPTDQLAKFQGSPHGKRLIVEQDPRAPDCVSCHSNHGIRKAKSPLSLVSPKNVPATCGACHSDEQRMAGFTLPDGSPLPTNQLTEYRESVHGRALLEKGDLGAPACNDCHGNHAAMPVGLASVSQSCSLCHAGNSSLFDGSRHKQAFEEHGWPQCAQCHGNHSVAKTSDAMLAEGEHSLCVECHSQYARDNPKCSATAEHFYDSLTSMQDALEMYHGIAEESATKGLDVDPIQEKLDELADHLKQSRSYIHSFNSNTFQQVASRGETSVKEIAQLVDEAREEYKTRQAGLLVSIGLLGLVMALLYLKLRRIEAG